VALVFNTRWIGDRNRNGTFEFASLSTEFAKVGKLSFSSNVLRQRDLSHEKNEFASLPRFLSRGGCTFLPAFVRPCPSSARPPTHISDWRTVAWGTHRGHLAMLALFSGFRGFPMAMLVAILARFVKGSR
jgi:hypothetical protein